MLQDSRRGLERVNYIHVYRGNGDTHTTVGWDNGKRTCSCRHPVANEIGAPYLRDGFWDRLGMEEGGMPKHLPMSLTVNEQGPAVGKEIDHWGCLCGDASCPLDRALREASHAHDWMNEVGLSTWTHAEDGRTCLQRPSSGKWWFRHDDTWFVPCHREDHG